MMTTKELAHLIFHAARDNDACTEEDILRVLEREVNCRWPGFNDGSTDIRTLLPLGRAYYTSSNGPGTRFDCAGGSE